jgi:release factor glutamine methyltransferase
LTKERWTVLRVLEWTQNYLRQKGIANPRLESELLLSYILGWDRVGLYLNYDMALSSRELEGFRKVIERRIMGEPLPYITGYQEFWSIRFKVGRCVLIPRPETEILVEETLHFIDQEGWQSPHIIEVGTGCGAIAVSIAKSVPLVKIMATDISAGAIALARENAMDQDVASKIWFVQGDMVSFVRSGMGGIFDLMISNPPYIRRGDIDDLQPEIRGFEPRKALDGGVDGLDSYRVLIGDAPSVLRRGGWLVLEIGADQGADILDLVRQIGGFEQTRIIPDYSGKSRAVVAKKAQRVKPMRTGPVTMIGDEGIDMR